MLWLTFVSAHSAAAAAPAAFDWFEYSGTEAGPAAGPGEFSNPILQGFYPDPSITQVGNDYYLVTSTFAYFPGLPVFHSRDLVNWTQVGNAIDRNSQLDFKALGLSRGVFAPGISWHDGTFYIANTCVDCGGNFVITASDPAGPWSDPAWLPDLEGGIDPSLVFEDGQAFILNNGPPPGEPKYDGHRAIWIQRFDTRTLKTFGPRTLLLDGGVRPEEKPIWIEGPHIFSKDGYYYLIAAEGGTSVNHSQVVLRSKAVTGPYEPFAGNPILTQRDLPEDRVLPVTSAGHADFVTTPSGEWWTTFLATRPYSGDYYNTGRETFLLPVRWVDGWPRITEPGARIPTILKRPDLPATAPPATPTRGTFTVREEFDGARLPPGWMMMRNPRQLWWSLQSGQLLLQPRAVALGDQGNPSFLARRQQHLQASATTSVRIDSRTGEAGLVALQNDDYWYAIVVGHDGGHPTITVKRRAGPDDPKVGKVVASRRLATQPGLPVQLRIRADGPAYAFDWSSDGTTWTTLVDKADGTILSTKTAGGFVGAVFGLYAYDGGAR
ncbi:glycoside hydrolase family 43 protein [Sphingomonas sabuli]|uniref:Glycoside hydrolase family 43 protein n=2 Tax=Sphingomonas sabuli TaxID=2764186 RepID=A0A7G9L5Y7_9SPHN|nr:glycoside hydrolase family 43 protein [Sphingomonas sabuli]QNM84036.1 glycoside hydrolase family 43 protein [Sphingomonas sabuli]